MLIGIISDTHDRLLRTQQAVAMLRDEGVEQLIHCGDLTGREVVEICSVLPCTFVFGNNDYDLPELRVAIEDTNGQCLEWGGVLTLAGRRIAVTHSHILKEYRRLIAERPDYLLFGHTHDASDEQRDGIRFINPGALHRAREHTVATLDLEKDAVRFLMVR
jgi:hypothetical protein